MRYHQNKKCWQFPGMLLFAACLFASANAQVIKGTVTGKSGQLPGATIEAKAFKKSAFTDLNGTFSLTLPATGAVTITISYIGHVPKTIDLNVKTGVNDAGIIELEAAQSQLGQVVVTGTMAPSQVKAYSIKKNAIAIMDVMAADAIGKLPDRNAAEAVQRMQGVAVARYHGEADAATVRGTPFAWTSALFNGSRMPSSNPLGNRSSSLDAVPSEMIQYVQVAKALTPDWEGDAIGGSINFITRTAPVKRQLNVSAASGYNTFSQNGTYNGSVLYGDRFFNNKLGVVLAGAIWDRQWGTDSYDVSYNTGAANATQQRSINTVMLKRYMGERQTFGANLGMEYNLSAVHKLIFRGIMDKFNDIRPVYESYIDYTNSRYQYNYRYSYYQTKLNGAEFGGEHQLGAKLKLDWTVSDYLSKYFVETPPTNEHKGVPVATFRQKIAGGFNNLSSDGKRYWGFDSPDGIGGDALHFDAGLKNSSEVMDDTKLTLQQLVIAQLDTREEDKTARVNLKYTLSAKVNIKAGGKFRHKERTSTYGSNIVYLPAAALGVPGAPALRTLSSLQRAGFPKGHGFFKEMDGNQDQYIVEPISKQQLYHLYTPDALGKYGFRDLTAASNATNLYAGTEDVVAGYVMAEIDATDKLKITGGLRNEHTSMELNGSKATTSSTGTTMEETVVKSNYNALLPMIHFKYNLSQQANLRAAYTRTFVRANFGDMTPGESIDNSKSPVTITKGNPDLKPTFANNFDLMGEYYFSNIGVLSGGFFYKQIQDVIFSNKIYYTEGNTNYVLAQAQNLDNAHLYGFEAGINKRLDFLRGFWSGFGIEFNYTWIKSEVSVPRTATSARITDKASLPNQSRNLFNAILFYERSGVMVRLAGNYRGKSIETLNQTLGPDFYVWTDKNFTVDASASISINKSLRLFVELNNLTNEPLRSYMGDRRRVTNREWYGLKGQAGLKWDIIK